MVDYLIEETLGKVLSDTFKCEITSQYKLKLNNKHYKIDYSFVIDGVRVFVEFNGLFHYTTAKQQLRDELIEMYATDNDIIFISIPYFIQLNNVTKYYFFDNIIFKKFLDSVDIEDIFPHGFIDKKCVLPCDFNIGGWNKFCRELDDISRFNISVSNDIKDSLIKRCEKYSIQIVIGENHNGIFPSTIIEKA